MPCISNYVAKFLTMSQRIPASRCKLSYYEGSPGCKTVTSSVPEASSLQMKGVFFGTPGGAEPPFTPIVTALIPSAVRMGIAFLVKPGTSLCKKNSTSFQTHPFQVIASAVICKGGCNFA